MFIKSPPFLKSLVIRGSNVEKMRLLLVILLATLGLLLAKPSQAGTVPIFWQKYNEWMKKFVSFPNDKNVSRLNIFPWIIQLENIFTDWKTDFTLKRIYFWERMRDFLRDFCTLWKVSTIYYYVDDKDSKNTNVETRESQWSSIVQRD